MKRPNTRPNRAVKKNALRTQYLGRTPSTIVVTKTKIPDPLTNELRLCKYSDVPFVNGWIPVGLYYPIPYDLLYLRIKGACKLLTGWWNGKAWEGLRIAKDAIVMAWKRYMDDRI